MERNFKGLGTRTSGRKKISDKIELVRLWQPAGLSHQMPGVKVYDERDISTLREAYLDEDECKESKRGIWYLSGLEDAVPSKSIANLIKPSKKSYIVSAHYPEGTFIWHYVNFEETAVEYGLIRTDKDGIEKAIERLKRGNERQSGDEISYGLEVDAEKAFKLVRGIHEREKRKKAIKFLRLPIEEQRKRLEDLLEFKL